MADQADIFAHRQWVKRKPLATNPFGDGAADTTRSFDQMEAMLKVKILHQLSVWAFVVPERLREKMANVDEKEQLTWRMEPCGYDNDGNTYYILDDNRLYRRTPWIAESTPAKKVKQKRKGAKRQRVSAAAAETTNDQQLSNEDEQNSIRGGVWSCVCVSLHDWTVFTDSLQSTKCPDERALCTYIKEEVLPELNKTWLEMEKQRLLQDAVANRKRSSRLDEKLARQKQEQEAAAVAKREADLVKAAEKARLQTEKRAQERETRVQSRAQRIKEREQRRREKAGASNKGANASSSSEENALPTRRSTRRRAATPTAPPNAEEWIFDCICGANGINYEDGTSIISCDTCSVWQHLACQTGLGPAVEGEYDFECDLCQRRKANPPPPPPPLQPKSPTQPPTKSQSTSPQSKLSPQLIKLRVGPPSPIKLRADAPHIAADIPPIQPQSQLELHPMVPHPDPLPLHPPTTEAAIGSIIKASGSMEGEIPS